MQATICQTYVTKIHAKDERIFFSNPKRHILITMYKYINEMSLTFFYFLVVISLFLKLRYFH